MWDKQKTDIFNKIKAINPNARASFYENKTVAEMLKILKSYESKNNKSKSLNKSKKKDNVSNKILKNKDYDTDESTESKFKKGLEYYYDLEDVDNKSFDIIEKQEENLITEGIHLIAHVRDKQSGEAVTIEDNDYNSKQQFENDLKSNGYVNISILDNRDLYLMDNSDFTKISQVKKKLRELKRDIEEYDEEKYPSLHKQAVDDYNNLKELYDKAMKVSLTEGYVLKGIDNGKSFDIAYNDNEEKLNKFKDELQNSHKNIDMYIIKESFNYVNKEDEPKLNDYIGLSMQINGTKTKIKTLKAKINKDKYDVDKNKHKYQLNYYEQLLNKYEDAMNNIKDLKESTTIKAKYKPMVKDFYKTPTGTWMIDLNDGYVTSYGTNYIEAKTKTQCIYELENFVTPYDYIHSDKDNLNENSSENSDSITLYHNTTNENAVKINKEGIKAGTRLSVYGKGSEAEGAGIWCTTKRGFGYGGATITFQVNKNEKELRQQNDTEYILYRDVTPKEIIDIDLVISNIPCVKHFDKSSNTTVESDIPNGIKKWGKDKLLKVFKNNAQSFVEPYNYEQLLKLIETGNKYCKGRITLYESKNRLNTKLIDTNQLPDIEYELEARSENKDYNNIYKKLLKSKTGKIRCTYNELDLISAIYLDNDNYDYDKLNIQKTLYESNCLNNEFKNKLEEVSRNDMLVKAKKQTITRYNKAAGYRGFSIIDIDTTSVLTTNCLRVTCKVGDYWDTVEMQNILYWIQAEAEKNRNYQVNTKGVTAAIMNSIDGMDIKVDCTCPDFKYRFAYLATKLGYKYGKPENRPAKITNPNDYGAICKHLISMLGNKKWLQQVTGTLMDFIVKRIDDVNKFLRVRPGEELTLPNELARQNAKLGFYSKLFKDKEDEVGDQGEENENQKDTTDSKTNTKDTIKDNNNNNNTNDIRSNNIKNINQDKGDEN